MLSKAFSHWLKACQSTDRKHDLTLAHMINTDTDDLGAFQKHLQACKFSSIDYTSFNVWVRYFVWNFKGNL